MFVRVKTIKGRKYAYLVENEWTPWGSRQKVAKYLGRAYKLDRLKDETCELPETWDRAVKEAIKQELANHGFSEYEGKYIYGEICANLEKGTVKERKKDIVIGMNEGYLCKETIQQLTEFETEDRDDKTAKKLATLALESGLKLSEEQFVHLFVQKNLKEKRQAKTQ